MKFTKITIITALIVCTSTLAFSQSKSVQQSGTVTAGHGASWTAPGIIQDAGTSTNPNLTTLGVYGTGTPFCVSNTKVRTGGWYNLCLGYPTDLSAANITLLANGGAPNIPLNLIIDGVTYSIGGSGNWLSAIFDQQFGSAIGDLVCRSASAWVALPAGGAGQVLTSNGTNGCPQWSSGGATTPLLRVVTSGTTDTALTTDGTVAWASASASGKTETLYACNSGNNGKVLYIKDAQGTAGTYPITIAPNGSDTIDGQALYTMAFNYQAVMLQCYGAATKWMVL
jgi:hypothetical protein